MAGKGFPLIPVSFLVEDDSDNETMAQFLKRHAAAPRRPAKSKPKAATDTSRKSAALSQLAKAFKGGQGTSKKPASSSAKPAQSPSATATTKAERPSPPAVLQPAAKIPKIRDPHADVDHPPSKHEAFGHETPSLRERARPNMIPFDERHEDFHQRYHAKGASLKKIEHLPGSANSVFHGKMDDDTQYIMKPHGGAAGGFAPEDWGKRHGAVVRLMSHMGAEHMVTPGMNSAAHASDMIPGSHPSKELAGGRSAHSHAGGKAFITEFASNTVKTGRATSAQLDGVDGEHRLMGIVAHLMTHNSDGHGGNVLIDEEHGHPVIIDHDLTMALGEKRGEIRSVFLPGGLLDYQAKLGKVGKNFPHRIKKTLEWLSGGGHYHEEMGLDVERKDGDLMQRMASNMLNHGLEGALKRIRRLQNF